MRKTDIEVDLTSGFSERAAIETPHSTAFGEFTRGQDEDGEDTLSFTVVQNLTGPTLPETFTVATPDPEHWELISRLPPRDYAVEASFQGDQELPMELLWIDAREVFRPRSPDVLDETMLLRRLQDRHLTQEDHYSAENFIYDVVTPNELATNLDPHAPDVTAGQIRTAIEEMQKSHAKGELSPVIAADFDEAPGFSWAEPEDLRGRLAAAVRGVVQRYGEPILSDRSAREGEAGLANTLKLADIVVRDPDSFPDARGELAQLKKGGLIFMIKSASREDEMISALPNQEYRKDEIEN
jgi:hypothetical protein